MDSLLSMKVFLQVVQAGSFVGAAQRLQLSTALVSRHVMHLEDRLGARLLHRTTRRLSLTESGRAYYERCGHALAELEEAELAIGAASSTPRGKLRVNALLSFGARHVAPALADYVAKYPQVVVELALNDRVVDIVEEGFDLALRAAFDELSASTLIAKQITRAHFVVCAAPSYLNSHAAPRKPEDLARHNCLVTVPSLNAEGWTLKWGARRYKVKVSGNVRTNNGDALRAAALAGAGIVYLSTDIIGEDLAAGRLVRLAPFEPVEMKIYAVYPTRRHLSAKVRSFVEFLAQRFSANPYWEDWRNAPVATKKNSKASAARRRAAQ